MQRTLKTQQFFRCLRVVFGPLLTWLKYETDISVAILCEFLHHTEPCTVTCSWRIEAIVVVLCIIICTVEPPGECWQAYALAKHEWQVFAFYGLLCGAAFVIHQILTTN